MVCCKSRYGCVSKYDPSLELYTYHGLPVDHSFKKLHRIGLPKKLANNQRTRVLNHRTAHLFSHRYTAIRAYDDSSQCCGYFSTVAPSSAASAVFHKSPAVMAAALKFFLGQDAAAAAGDEDDSDDDDAAADEDEKGKQVLVQPTKEDVYKAMHKVGFVLDFCCFRDCIS